MRQAERRAFPPEDEGQICSRGRMSFSILEHRQSPALALRLQQPATPSDHTSPAGVRCLGAAGCLNPTQGPLQRIWLFCHWDLIHHRLHDL